MGTTVRPIAQLPHARGTKESPGSSRGWLPRGTHLQPAGHGILAKGALRDPVKRVAVVPLQRVLAGHRHAQLQGSGDDLCERRREAGSFTGGTHSWP
jgi:hypothetical protein